MAKLFSKYGASAFGEAFVSSYELEKKINERRQELEQEYNFKRRQMSLDETFRRDQLEETKRLHDLYGSQEERLRESQGADIENMYVPVKEGVEGSISGSELQQKYPTLGSTFSPEQYYLDKDLIQKQPELKKFGEGIIGGGKYATYGIPGEEETTRYYLGEGETKGGNGKDKEYLKELEKRWDTYQTALDRQEAFNKGEKVMYTDPLRGYTTLTKDQIEGGVTSAKNQFMSFLDRNLSTDTDRQIKKYKNELPSEGDVNFIPTLLNTLKEDWNKIPEDVREELLYYYSAKLDYNFFNYFR